MKKIIYVFFLSLLCFSIMTHCSTNRCKKVTCVNGTCTDGTCICENGYEGSTCEIAVNKFLGKWTGSITSSTSTSPITLNITEGSASNQVVINDMLFCLGASIPINAVVSSNTIQSIDNIICSGNTLTFSPVDWTISDNKMVFTIGINNGLQTITGNLTR